MKTLTAWSYSRWQTYEQCPLKAKLKFIDKLPEPSSPPMERGSAIHKLAENYVRGDIKKLPPELKLMKGKFKDLVKAEALAEEQWCFTRKWEVTGWFDANAWLRIKVDALNPNLKTRTLLIVDHKTGREKPDHMAQLSLYAMGGFIKHTDMEVVDAQLWYLDSGVPRSMLFKRSELPALKKDWTGKTKAMLSDTTFAPRPGNYCRWCHFSKAQGGPCKY